MSPPLSSVGVNGGKIIGRATRSFGFDAECPLLDVVVGDFDAVFDRQDIAYSGVDISDITTGGSQHMTPAAGGRGLAKTSLFRPGDGSFSAERREVR